MDKRDLSSVFRERLKMVVRRSDLNQSAFAAAVGIDRSALSQLLSGATTRLPRAETLLKIAAENKVSLDWLLGLSQDEGLTGEIRASFELEEASAASTRPCWPAGMAKPRARKSVTCRPASRPAAHRSADRLRGRTSPTRAAIPGGRDAIPDRLFAPARDRHGGLHAAAYDGDFCPRARRVGDFPRGAARTVAHMARCSTISTRPSASILYDGRMRYSVPYTISALSARRSMSGTCTWC